MLMPHSAWLFSSDIKAFAYSQHYFPFKTAVQLLQCEHSVNPLKFSGASVSMASLEICIVRRPGSPSWPWQSLVQQYCWPLAYSPEVFSLLFTFSIIKNWSASSIQKSVFMLDSVCISRRLSLGQWQSYASTTPDGMAVTSKKQDQEPISTLCTS